MTKTIFITGTDTDVGKTLVSSAILHYAAQHGLTTAGFKPIAAGCQLTSQGLRNNDALLLQQYATVELDYEIVNPIAFLEPIAPHIAADNLDQVIDLNVVDKALTQIPSNLDLVVIEGAGGWHLPIDPTHYFSTWVSDNKLDVILVVGMKLGCLNHALLSAQAIMISDANLVGWIANNVSADIPYCDDMINTLISALDVPLMGKIPYYANRDHITEKSSQKLYLGDFLGTN